MKLKLSKPQRSAVECADLESHGALRAAARHLHTGYLIVPDEPLHRDALVADLTEAANSEDACWQALGDRGAVGACRALTNLARRVRALALSAALVACSGAPPDEPEPEPLPACASCDGGGSAVWTPGDAGAEAG